MNRSDIGKKHRMAAASYRDKITIRTRLHLQEEDVGGLFAVEDEEDLGKEPIAFDGLQRHNEVDAGFEKSEIFSRH